MTSVELSDEELTLLRNAVTAFLGDFGHDERDIIDRLRGLLSKLDAESSRTP